MISIPMFWQLVVLLIAHFVADFVLQTHWQASNKSKRLDALALHVGTYTLVLAAVSVAMLGIKLGVAYALLNGWLHFMTDFCTSRLSSRLWAKQDWHNFFVVIGFDQLIHQVTLAGTLAALLAHT